MEVLNTLTFNLLNGYFLETQICRQQICTKLKEIRTEISEKVDDFMKKKSKTKEPRKILTSSGIRDSKFISVYSFPTQ